MHSEVGDSAHIAQLGMVSFLWVEVTGGQGEGGPMSRRSDRLCHRTFTSATHASPLPGLTMHYPAVELQMSRLIDWRLKEG